jgi:hypothetical protein
LWMIERLAKIYCYACAQIDALLGG